MILQSEWIKEELSQSEHEMKHRSLGEEYSFYKAVRDGNMEFVLKNCNENSFINPDGMGVLSKNPLTSLKYHFVVTAAMITRYCIEGGLETEQAYRLSDFYILKMDTASSKQEVSSLHHAMVIDFTSKMQYLQKKSVISKPISQCIDYIYNHINERITIQDLAGFTQLSPSYLSRLFKQNLGSSVSNYIRDRKIEKAKNLLRYSDYSFIQIACYLAFSSQSHFIQIFSHNTGMTPKQYRDKFYKVHW